MKIVHAPGTSLLHAQRPLELELEHADAAVTGDPLDLRPQRAVPLARDVLDVLEELAGLDARAELVLVEEPVLAPVLLPGALRPRRRRDRDLELGSRSTSAADQRALAGAGRAGDDEDGVHVSQRRDVGSPPARPEITGG